MIQNIFAYNTGSLISGTTQVGDIAVKEVDVEYSANFGGLQWWGGPDQTNGYVICYPVPGCDRPTPVGILACLGFKRSQALTEPSFLELANEFVGGPPAPFASGNDASIYLTNNGYWNSWVLSTPTPTPTNNPTPTPTVTPTNTETPTPTVTPTNTETPTNTPTVTQTNTETPTNTPTITNTNTPTITSTPTGSQPSISSLFNMYLFESGSDVIMSGTGQFNLTDLVYRQTGNFNGFVIPNTASLSAGSNLTPRPVDLYTGTTLTFPPNFGVSGLTNANIGSGDMVSVLKQSGPSTIYNLVVPSGYTSNTTLTTQSTFTGKTLTSLGVTVGTYTYSWGSGVNIGNLTFYVGVTP